MKSEYLGAIDIGGTKIAVGIVTTKGKIICRQEIKTNSDLHFKESSAQIISILKNSVYTFNVKLAAIGIGATGQIDSSNGKMISNAFLPNWSGILISQYFSQQLRLPVFIENDADAATLAESKWGVGYNKKRFLYLTLSTGVGGGFLINGRIYRGTDGIHPEVGHHVVNPQGPFCFCGKNGCWETLASGTALERNWKNLFSNEKSAQQICQLAREGNEKAQALINQHGYWIGVGISNLIHLFVPDSIALGGGFSRSFDLFSPSMYKALSNANSLVPVKTEIIQQAILEPNTGLLGAACTALQNIE